MAAAERSADEALDGTNGGAGPPPPTGLSPAEQARLAAVDHRAGTAVAATTELPTAGEQVGEARQAVQEPSEESEARAQDRLVEVLGERPEPSPEIEALCEQIRQVIREKRPPDEESLVDARPEEMAQEAGRDLNDSVEGDAERIQAEYSELEERPQGAPARDAAPMTSPPGPAAAPNIDGERATPDGVAAEAVSLDADVEAAERQVEEAGMNSAPAQLVQSGPLAEARAAQGELSDTAAQDPQAVLAEQQAILSNASADMSALTASALTSLRGERTRTTTGGRAQQHGMVGSEEAMRVEAAAQAEGIFSDAQTRVAALLEPLPRTAMGRWEAGVGVLSTRFEQHLDRVQRWIDERHESTVLSVVDYFTGLPGWVTAEYDRAEQAFGDGVCDLIREISTEVNGVIMACEAIIGDARTQIRAVFDSLPAELQEWAAEQQAEFGERLDGLREQAEQTRSDFTQELTERAAEAVQSVREQVHELREAARGLLGRIADAVDAFLDDPARFILEGLLELVGIAPSAFWAVVDRIGQAIEDIADDPLGFAGNLLSALGQGFQQFFDNIGDHLLQGLLDWLFSGLGAVGVQIPTDTSLSSIITFFLQLMGLTWANIREILVRHLGEENVALIERAWELVSALIEMGPEGLFELVREQLDPANLLSIVLEAAVEFLIEALISAVTPRIIALFNPVGAIVQAVEAIYRVLRWIFENAARIFSLVETVVNGVTDLIAGNIGGMATAVESALARLITPVIDFLAGYLGLGDLPEKIADVIRSMQERVLAVVDRVIVFLAEQARALLRTLGLGEDEEVGEEDPERAERVRAGLAAVRTEEARRAEAGRISREEAEEVVDVVRREHTVFTALDVVDGGDSWDYRWAASPGDLEETEVKKEEADSGAVPDATVSVPFDMGGEQHTMTGITTGGTLEIRVASRDVVIAAGLFSAISELEGMDSFPGRSTILSRLRQAQTASDYNTIMTAWLALTAEQGSELPQGVNDWPKFLEYRLSTVISEISDLAVGSKRITALTELYVRLNRNNGPYAHMTDPPRVAPFKEFSSTQRREILEENRKRNGGEIVDDESGVILDDTLPISHPLKPNIDHIFARVLGGSNSYSNAQVVGGRDNRAKGTRRIDPFGLPSATGPTTAVPPIVRRRPHRDDS